MPDRTGLLGFVALLSACCAQSAPDEAQRDKLKHYDELIAYLETPSYGLPRAITGKAVYGQETTMIGLCRTERRACVAPTNVDGSDQPCWLVFTEAGAASLAKATGRQYQQDGEYWIEGEGRIAVRPGGFGHLSEYGCQVEISHVRVFEEGPPWMWSPPPPVDAGPGKR